MTVIKSSHPYINHKLDASKSEIRLITSVKLGPDGLIELKTETKPLKVAGDNHFTAISYTWGFKTPMFVLRLNGALLQVRENVNQFFQHTIRHNIVTLPVWVDSICIDQDDLDEKNHQVAMMGDIYASASQVIVWLGRASIQPLSSIVLGAWTVEGQVSSKIRSEPTFLTRFSAWLWGYSGANWFHPTVYAPGDEPWLFKIDNFDPRRLFARMYRNLFLWAFQAIDESQYWHRMWIVQELALARKAYIIFGQDLLSVDRSMAVVQTAYRGKKRKTQCAHFFQQLAFTLPHEKRDYILDMWVLPDIWCNSMECHDARDKIYGLLGLTPWRGSFAVDYNEPIAELYARVLLRLQEDGPQKMESKGEAIRSGDRVIYAGFILSNSLGISTAGIVDTLKSSPTTYPALESCVLPIILSVEQIRFEHNFQKISNSNFAHPCSYPDLDLGIFSRPGDLDCTVIQALRKYRGPSIIFDSRIDIHRGLRDVHVRFCAVRPASEDENTLTVICIAASKTSSIFDRIGSEIPKLCRRPPARLGASAKLHFESQIDAEEDHPVTLTVTAALLSFIVNDDNE